MIRYEVVIGAKAATMGVGAVGVGVVHTVIGAWLVVVSVHVGHDGRCVLGDGRRRLEDTRCWRV